MSKSIATINQDPKSWTLVKKIPKRKPKTKQKE